MLKAWLFLFMKLERYKAIKDIICLVCLGKINPLELEDCRDKLKKEFSGWEIVLCCQDEFCDFLKPPTLPYSKLNYRDYIAVESIPAIPGGVEWFVSKSITKNSI